MWMLPTLTPRMRMRPPPVYRWKALPAKRAHQATLREQEEERVAHAKEQAEMRKLAERIARGE